MFNETGRKSIRTPTSKIPKWSIHRHSCQTPCTFSDLDQFISPQVRYFRKRNTNENPKRSFKVKGSLSVNTPDMGNLDNMGRSLFIYPNDRGEFSKELLEDSLQQLRPLNIQRKKRIARPAILKGLLPSIFER